ncbi:hypothetical protein [Amphibacillus sediminis]|nr:hypothetical protein [Amphibacillus sediminis]
MKLKQAPSVFVALICFYWQVLFTANNTTIIKVTVPMPFKKTTLYPVL